MKTALTVFLFLAVIIVLPAYTNAYPEVWAYLMKGEEQYFPEVSPITDVACFSASIDGDGALTGGHLTPPKLQDSTLRYHLVVTMPWNATLASLYFNPELPFRNRIIHEIVTRSKPFDGVQIDFECIPKEEGTAYLNFLSAVKKALPDKKRFSVAVLARWEGHKQKHPNDAFDYPFIGMIADRVVVMAYDEHYRTGPAGPIASLAWCKEIFGYALKTIPTDKLVMGLPLYGRSWQKESVARAYRNPEIWSDLRMNQAQLQSNPDNGGSYTYTTNVTVQVHFETMNSLDAKIKLYSTSPIRGIAFWRVGQEPLGFWEHLAK